MKKKVKKIKKIKKKDRLDEAYDLFHSWTEKYTGQGVIDLLKGKT